MLLIVGVFLFSLYLPVVFLAGRSSEEDRRMRARFAELKSTRVSGAASNLQTELLKSAGGTQTGAAQLLVHWFSERFALEMLLLQANSRWSSQGVVQLVLGMGVGSGLLALAGLHNWLLATVAVCAGGFMPVFWLKAKARRRTAAMSRVLPDVSDMISRALRAGHSISAALGIVAEEAAEPARSAFGDVFQKQKFGLPLRDAMLEMVRCFPADDLKVLVTAILVQRDSGGNLVQILERTSTVIRERQKLAGDVRVHTAQGRMTGWVLCLLPVLMLGVLMLTNPSYPRVLLDDPLGRKLMYVGVGLLALGGFLIQRIVKGIEV